jgi:hypothetical protein
MTDMGKLLQRQAAWQAGRRRLSCPEKVRMAEAMRESAIQFRALRLAEPKTGSAKRPRTPGG